MTMSPDWTKRLDVRGIDREEFYSLRREMVAFIRERGATFMRMTVLPDVENPVELVTEGWRERPDDQGPLPTLTMSICFRGCLCLRCAAMPANDVITGEVGRAMDDAIGMKALPKKVEPAPSKPAFPMRALRESGAGQAPVIEREP